MHVYSSRFYEYIQRGSIASARVIVPLLASQLPVRTVADFGCGQGAWLWVWQGSGAIKTIGVDGPYVPRDALLIDASDFVAADLTGPVDLGRSFDLVQSLEVAEHLPQASSASYVDTLVAHSQIVLFSAAVPGQGGENHLNEQPYEYWRALFRDRDYVPFDPVRPRVFRNEAVEWWYRYNVLLYVHISRIDTLSGELAGTRITEGLPIPDFSPLGFRMRKAVLRRLPTQAVNWLAVLKHDWRKAWGGHLGWASRASRR